MSNFSYLLSISYRNSLELKKFLRGDYEHEAFKYYRFPVPWVSALYHMSHGHTCNYVVSLTGLTNNLKYLSSASYWFHLPLELMMTSILKSFSLYFILTLVSVFVVLKSVIVVMLLSIVFLLYNHQYFPYWALM